MRRRAARRMAAAIALSALAGALSVGLTAGALTNGAFRDHFGAASFTGDDGDLSWSGPWEEVGESDGPAAGAVRVKAGVGCAVGNCLELGTFTGGDGSGVLRSADLSGSTTATLSFSRLRVKKAGGGAIVLSVSSTGGPPWVKLRSYRFTDSDPGQVSETIDISSYIGAATTIRLTISGDDVRSRFTVDDIEIEVVGVPVTTTTTAPVTTTTTAPVTTTTTAPVTTTTMPVTTTTMPVTTTTTTEPPQAAPGAALPPAALERPTGDRPTMGLTLAGNAPGPEDRAPEEPTGVLRPLTRMTAVFATGAETISSPPIAITILAIVVAWVSVRGLERAPRSRLIVMGRRRRRVR
ncbi:MAG: hypothetical protein KJ698_09480 [Actinobacteria bacterium]|nr:hypothetical protein [Actinomycetota bacterium]